MSGNLNRFDSSVLASWPTPNYIDPVRRSWMPIYAGVLQGASSLVVITRLWLRARNKAGPLGLDDALLLPGWIGSISFTVFLLLSTERWGSGTHVWDVPIPFFEPLAMAAWASEVSFIFSTGCTKCSILFFYRRLTKGTYNKRWVYAIWAAIAVTALYSIAFILMLIFACSPTEAYWRSFDLTYQEKFTCLDTAYANVLSGAMSAISDLWSVLLPCLMLRNLDAPRRQKIALNIIFSLGLLVVAAGSVRTYYLEKVGHSADLTWKGYDVFIWAQLETQLSLICASAPTLRALFRTYSSRSIINKLTPSARSHNRRESRRKSMKLPDDSTGSGPRQDKSPIALDSIAAEKQPHTLTSSSEEELTAAAAFPTHGRPANKSMDTTTRASSDAEYDLRDLEAHQPPPVLYARNSEHIFIPEGISRQQQHVGRF